MGQSDLIIVGVFLSVADVREYNVGAMLVYYSATFIGIIGNTFFPTIQRAVSGGTLGEVRHLFYRQLKITLCFGLLVYLGFVIFSRPFIHLWMYQDNFSSDSVIAASGVMVVLSLSKFPTLYIRPCLDILSAMGHVGFTARISFYEAIVNLILSIVFVKFCEFGLIGVSLGTLIARLVVPTFILPVYTCQKMDIKMISLIKSSVVPSFLSTSLFVIFCYFLTKTYLPDTWLLFFIEVIVSVILWGGIASVLLLPKDIQRRGLMRLKFKSYFLAKL